jgi:carbonic anhydrase
MTITDDLLRNNQTYAQQFKSDQLTMPPARKVAIVACMDARLTIEPMLGLNTGDAHVIRNAGGIVTEDVLRSLLISHYLLGTQEILIINHTDCGMLTFRDHELRDRLRQLTGKLAVAPSQFLAFPNLERNVAEQLLKLRSHPWMPQGISTRGFVYDVKSGRLSEVEAERQLKAA